jgi:hypothetical protein
MSNPYFKPGLPCRKSAFSLPAAAFGIILTCLLFSPAMAQTTTGSLGGRVTDDKNQPIAGAIVTVTAPSIQGTKKAVTDVGGEYTVPFLPPSPKAMVEVEAPGYSKVQFPVEIQPGVITTRHASLGGTAETVVVSTTMVSPRQAMVPMVLPEEEVRSLPVLGEFQDRSYQSLLYWTPGATHSRLSGNPAVAGATGLENVYLIDGIYTNDFVFGTFGTNLNVSFFREMSTETFGVEAENGTSTGGFFNLITKTGSNEFHGEVFGWTTARNWTAKVRPNDFEVEKSQPWSAYDLGFDVGGPIVKDRLWYFIGYNPYTKNESDLGVDELTNTVNGSTLDLPMDRDKSWRTTTWVAKLNWRASDKHSFEFVTFGDPSTQNIWEGLTPTLYPVAGKSRRTVASTSEGLRWYASFSPRFFLEARMAATQSKNNLLPRLSGANGFGTPQWVSQDWDSDLGVSPGFGKFALNDRRSLQLGFKSVWTPAWAGSHHEVTFGGEYDDLDWDQTSGYTGGYMMQLKKQKAGTADITDPASYKNWYVYSVQDPHYREGGAYCALFAQDRWTIAEDFTLTAGLRWERNRLDSQRGNDLSLSSLSPRIGLSWDFLRNDRSKLYFSWGRYYERVPLFLTQFLDAGHASYKGTFTNGVKTAIATYNQLPASALGGVDNQSQDEVVLGVEWEALPDLVLGARAVYRNLNKLLETVGVYDAATGNINYLVMNPGHQTTPLLDTWRGVIPSYMSFPKPERKYRALELICEKRFTNRWFFQGNYTWSRLEGNTAAGYDRNIPELTPNATKEFDIPSAAWTANRYGYLSTDRTHQAKVFGGYRWDWGLLLGATVRYDTGRPISKLVDWPKNEVGYGKLFVTPRGSEGRIPSALTVNVHAEYTWKIGRTTLTVYGDVINLTNSQPAFRVEELYYEKPSNWGDKPVVNPAWGKIRSRTESRAGAFGFRWAF